MRIEYIRQQVLQDWRGLAENPEPLDRCVTAAEALKKLMPRLGLTERLNEQEVQNAWLDIVGPFLATHSTPASLKDGILVVQVLQPTVRYELDRTWKSDILKKLKARFGAKAIKEVRFR
jgi:predicted nucleic acid-binding Zn ribbon protein